MDIKQTKEEIRRTVLAYTERDALGALRIPMVRQRPLLLMGPPGVGKTAIFYQLAQELGMPEDNVIILEMGQALELSEDEANITGPIPTGSVMVDGLGVGDVGNVVLRDRKHLSQDGLIIVVVGVSKETGQVTSGPELISRGFVYVRENEELISGARNVAMNVLQRYDRIEQSDWTSVKNGIKDEMHNYLFDLIKRNPMILPIIMET